MSYHYHLIIGIGFVLTLTTSFTSPTSIKNRLTSSKNVSSSPGIRQRISSQTGKLSNITSSTREHWKHSHENHDEYIDENAYYEHEQSSSSSKDKIASVVVLTSLSGIYVWWPEWFGGDNSFHLLLTQDDVPRFHDVTSDEHGHIYLTAPHERTVYRLQYADGWWISNFSNHSVMNSIRSEMPLFLTIHHVSSILYVYGHSDIQIIDLLQRPRARGSAPFMKRLRELSPSLRISDMIIDQLTSDGYIVGDSYGWCTIIRCSLSVNECEFLFKIPSSYDNRPYPCTGTIDFSKKTMYLSLEDKILIIYLNEQTQYDRRSILTEKHGPRSTLGYDDIVTFNNTILYTDVLRPILHICTSKYSNPCLNMSLILESSHRTILPLRLTVVQAPNLQPPIDEDSENEIHDSDQSTTGLTPLALNGSSNIILSVNHTSSTKPIDNKKSNLSNILMLLLGVCIGLVLAGISFMIYYVTFNKNRPNIKKSLPSSSVSPSRDKILPNSRPIIVRNHPNGRKQKPKPVFEPTQPLIPPSSGGSTTSSSDTTNTTSSSSYRPDTIL